MPDPRSRYTSAMGKGWMVVMLLACTAYGEPETKAERVWKGSSHLVVYDLEPVARSAFESKWWIAHIEKSPLGVAARRWGTDLRGKALLRQLGMMTQFIPRQCRVQLARNGLAELIRFTHLLDLFDLMAVDATTAEEEAEFERARNEFRDVLDKLGTCRMQATVEMRDKHGAATILSLARMFIQELAIELDAPVRPVRNGFTFDFDIGSSLIEHWSDVLEDERRPGLKAALKRFRISFRLVQRGPKLVLDVGPLDDLVDPPARELVRGDRIAEWSAHWLPARAALQEFRKSDERWANTQLGRKVAAEQTPEERADEATEAELDEIEVFLTEASGSIEVVPLGLKTRLTWKEPGRVPSLGTLPAARFLAEEGLFTWASSGTMPNLARNLYTAIEGRLYLRSVLRDAEAVYREFLGRFGAAGEALAKLEGFGPGAVMLVDLRRTKVRVDGIEHNLCVPEFCIVGSVSDRKLAERAIVEIGRLLSGSKDAAVMRRDPRLNLGPDAYRLEGGNELTRKIAEFVPHVAFVGDTCLIGTSPTWTRTLHEAVKRNKNARMPWGQELRPIEYIRFDGRRLARFSTVFGEWMSAMRGQPMDPAMDGVISHVLTLIDSAEYWTTTDGETRNAVYRLRMIGLAGD